MIDINMWLNYRYNTHPKIFFAGATISLGGPAACNQAVAEGPDDEPEIEELLSRRIEDRK